MNWWLLVLAGTAAGIVNSAVGSGSLITFPLLVAWGIPPVNANATNTLGLAPGGLVAAFGYRRELADRHRSIWPLVAVMSAGAVIGTLLVIRLPPAVFAAVVPWLILGAVILVLVQPAITRALATRSGATELPAAWPAVAVSGVYAGYFGAGLGIALMAVLATTYDSDLQRSNALKNLLAGFGNSVSAVIFAISGLVLWPQALALVIGSAVGGVIGARFARSLPDPVLRGVTVATGLVAAAVTFARLYG